MASLLEIITRGAATSLFDIAAPSPDVQVPRFRLPRPPLVPLMVAGITLLAYGVVRSIWPPPLTVLLAPLASYALARNRGEEVGGAIVAAVLSTLLTLLIIWVFVLVAGAIAVLNCFAPNGGCIPW